MNSAAGFIEKQTCPMELGAHSVRPPRKILLQRFRKKQLTSSDLNVHNIIIPQFKNPFQVVPLLVQPEN